MFDPAGVICRTPNAECRSAVYYTKHALSNLVALKNVQAMVAIPFIKISDR